VSAHAPLRAGTQPPEPAAAPHAADSHDLIRVRGARENNLREVSAELPERRLTVLTGVPGRSWRTPAGSSAPAVRA